MNVAKWYDEDKTDDTAYMGTQHYAAPEQIGYGFKASSAKTDIYAVGVLLNVMLTGRFPKERRATGKVWDIIERCIRLNAEERYKKAMEINKPTNELDSVLENMKPDQLDEFFNKYGKGVADEKKAFYYYYTGVVKDNGIKLKDVYSFAGESESYGGQVVRMEKRTKDRDLILRLCIAGHFSLEETNRALKLSGMPELYSKNSRDACLIVAISNRIYRLDKIDDMLEKRSLQKITKDE